MQAFSEFRDMSPEFWALVKFVSQELGYTNRITKSVRTFSEQEIKGVLDYFDLVADARMIRNVSDYSIARADVINTHIQRMLMDAQDVQEIFHDLMDVRYRYGLKCDIPMNKQSGDKKQPAYFTAIVNILAERTIREVAGVTDCIGFDDNPLSLSCIIDENRHIVGASSRRFDGAYPDVFNPKIVWEIKEYYYSKSFGSRVADGVYETQLDGFEFKDLYDRTQHHVHHVFFVDGYTNWWEKGKSYLCRIVDILNAGFVDEVIVGREVVSRWPEVLSDYIV